MSGRPDKDAGQGGRRTDSWDAWADPALDEADSARPPVFLGRDIYRRRRVMDAARLLPAFGTVLLLLPVLWAPDHGTATGGVYVFLIWLGLILAAAFLSRRLSEPLRSPPEDDVTEPGAD